MSPFWETYEGMDGPPPVKRTRTDETKIAWLAAQVSHTLTVLAEHGKLQTAIRALLSTICDQETADAVTLLIEQYRVDYADSQKETHHARS